MDAEIITVGTEILLGQIVNTNVQMISEFLQGLGINVYFHTTVGDNESRLRLAINTASKRVDLIILCGGLGPTTDDITKQVLADILQEELVVHNPSYRKIVDYFSVTGRTYTPNNDLQALIMKNATPIPNETGFAVGALISKNGKKYVILPGPPQELKVMLFNHVQLLLKSQLKVQSQLFSRVLRFYGIGESLLATKLEHIINNQQKVTIAPYAKIGEVILCLSVKSTDEETACKLLDEVEQSIFAVDDVHNFFYGYGDGNSLVKVTVQLLQSSRKTVTAAESITGGSFQATLCSISGASGVFQGGFVVYSLEQKANLLQIDKQQLIENGTVSEYTAKCMAENSLRLTNSDFALSFTGVAGPNALEDQDIGDVFIGLAEQNKDTVVIKIKCVNGRESIVKHSVLKGLDMLRRRLLECD